MLTNPQITEHFAVAEFACHDGTAYPEEWITDRLTPLCRQLEVIRAVLGTPVHVLSGFRTEAYNAKIGGAKFSQHKQGRAADITVEGFLPDYVHQTILDLYLDGKISIGGLGQYPTFTHVDIRPIAVDGHLAQWTGGRTAS
jgi:uncharacterized protein YcbK (DUF882 family)